MLLQVLEDREQEKQQQRAGQKHRHRAKQATQRLIARPAPAQHHAPRKRTHRKHGARHRLHNPVARQQLLRRYPGQQSAPLRQTHKLIQHHRQQRLPAPKHNAAEAVKILKNVIELPVRPVLYAGHLAQQARQQKDSRKQPQVHPAYRLRLAHDCRYPPAAKIANRARQYQHHGKYPRTMNEAYRQETTQHNEARRRLNHVLFHQPRRRKEDESHAHRRHVGK